MTNETNSSLALVGIMLALLFSVAGVMIVLFLEGRDLSWTLKFLGLVCVGGSILVLLAARFERFNQYIPYLLIALISQTGFTFAFKPGYHTSATEVFSVVIIFIWVFNRFVRGEELLPKAYFTKPLLAYYAVGIFGIFTALQIFSVMPINIFVTAKSYLLYPLYLLILPNCVKSEKDLIRLCWAMLLFSLLPLSYAVSGAMDVDDVFSKRLDVELWGALNVFVGYIVPVSLVALGLSLSRKRGMWILICPFLLMIGYTLLLSQTRSGWVAFITAAAIFMVLSRKKLVFTLLFVGLAVGVMLSPLGATLESIVQKRIVEQTVTADSSLQIRYERWSVAWETAVSHPLTGSGWGGFLAPAANGLSDKSLPLLPLWHNSYLEILSQTGFPGLLMFLWLWSRILGREAAWLPKLRDVRGLGLHIGLWAAVFSCLVYALGEQQFYRLEIASHTYLLASLLIASGRILRQKARLEVNV